MWGSAIFPDVELALCAYLRPYLPDAYVGNDLPPTLTATRTYVVVRYDGGRSELAAERAQVGVRVIGPTGSKQATGDLARRVRALIEAAPLDPSTPIADASCSGPVRVPSDRVERYLTASLVVAGAQFNPSL